jgi:hypothetical protein
VSRKSREQQQRNREQRGLTEEQPAAQPLWGRRMEERALREGWNLPPHIKSTIVSRLVDVVETDEHKLLIVGERYLLAAAKTLIYADLGQQRLDLARQKLAADTEAVPADAARGRGPETAARRRRTAPGLPAPPP